jgi:hypothetical protein
MQRSMKTDGFRAASAVVAVMTLGALAVTASAASLGGIGVADLFAWSSPVTVPIPSPVASDQFSCAGDLDGQPDDLGNIWSDHGGDWQCLGSGVVRARQRVDQGHATVDLLTSDAVSISVGLSDISTQGGRSGGGVAFLSDGLSHMYVVYQRDQGQVVMGRLEVAVDTVITTASVSDLDTAEIAVEIDQPTVRVLVNGAPVLTHTLTITETVIFGSNTRFGLASDNDNSTRFDWFRVESS